MDILIHTLSGVAVASVVINYTKIDRYRKAAIFICAGAMGGILPDIDAITMWSHFDSTFGKWLGLSRTGKEIFYSKLWYSHHAFFHSIVAGILFGLLLGLVIYTFRRFIFRNHIALSISLKSDFLLLVTFFSGFLTHLFGDMPTPAVEWGGVQLFWPFSAYIGGTGQIWWWNNYDIFLIVSSGIVVNLFLFVFSRMYGFKSIIVSVALFLVAIYLIIFQIRHRDFDFNYTGTAEEYMQCEIKSKEIQKRILGVELYRKMSILDSKVKVNF